MSNKKRYKLNASLINKYLYYKNNPYDNVLEQLKDSLNNIWVDNEYTILGKKFEQEVYNGKHGKLSSLIIPLEKQVWGNRTLNVGNVSIRFAGRLDALDRDKNVIYDIKRVGEFNERKYTDEQTVQHLIYFYLFPEVTDFYYLVTDRDLKTHVVHINNTIYANVEQKLTEVVIDFLNFLNEKGLLELYKTNFTI